MVDTLQPYVMPSGQSIGFLARDGSGGLANITSIVDGNEVQSVTITGQPAGSVVALGFGGQTTTNIPVTAVPPAKYFQWTISLGSTGQTRDLAVINPRAGLYGAHVLYEVLRPDGLTPIGSPVTINLKGDSGEGGGPVNAGAFDDPGGLMNVGAPGFFGPAVVKWQPLGRFTFPDATAIVRVSAPSGEFLAADNLRVATTDGATVVRYGTAVPPAFVTGSNGVDYVRVARFYQCNDDTSDTIEMQCLGSGTRYTIDPSAVQTALWALSSVGPGNASCTGDAQNSPLLIKYVGALAGVTQSLVTCADAAVHITRSATGGTLPVLKINGGSPIPLTYDSLYYNSLSAVMPTAVFVLPQSPPAATYSPAGCLDNGLYDNTALNNPGFSHIWGGGVPGGYNSTAGVPGSTLSTNYATPAATYTFRPVGPGQYRVSATWPHDATYTTDSLYTVRTTPELILPLINSTGSAQVITSGLRAIAVPGPVTATLVGNPYNVVVTVHGVNGSGSAISETLPAFSTTGPVTTVTGSLNFAAVVSVDLPSMPNNTAQVTLTTTPVTLGTYHANQTLAPSGSTDQGVVWHVIGTYTLTGANSGLVVVQQRGGADTAYIVADAVRFERLSADTSIRIAPGDVATLTWGAGWLSSATGTVAAQASPVTATNASGSKLVGDPPPSASMGFGWNMTETQPAYASYIYHNIARHSEGIGEYPTSDVNNQISLGVTTVAPSTGGDGKTWPNVPPGDYILVWDGLSDAHLTANTPVVETGTAVTGQATNNRRFYTLSADGLNYGAAYLSVVTHSISGSGPYNYDFSNLRIFPAGTDLANPPKYRADFLSRVAGTQSVRFAAPLRPNDNATDYGDYQKDDSRLSKALSVRTLSAAVASIGPYTGSTFRFDHSRGAPLLFTTRSAHPFTTGQRVTVKGYAGPSVTLTFPDSTTATFNPDGNAGHVFVIDATSFAVQMGPGWTFGSQVGPSVAATVTTSSTTQCLVMDVGNGLPVADCVEICNIAGCDFHFNSTVCMTPTAAGLVAAYIATHLNPGLKCLWEFTNETWNFNAYPYSYLSQQTYNLSMGTSDDVVPATVHFSGLQWAAAEAGWSGTGRSLAEFVRVFGSQHTNASVTGRIASAAHSQGVAFHRLMTAPYVNNTASSTQGAAWEVGFSAAIDRMTAGVHLDLWELHALYGNYQFDFPSHHDWLVYESGNPLGTVLYPENMDIPLMSYEGAPNVVTVPGGTTTNYLTLGHQIIRHPRWYYIWLSFLETFGTGPHPCTLFEHFAISGSDRGVQGLDGSYGEQWATYTGSAQLPYAPGNPTQDAIQTGQFDRLDLIQSVTGGASRAWASLFSGVTPMPGQLSVYYPTPSLSAIYFTIVRGTSQTWNGTAFENTVAGNWPSYAIAGSDALTASTYLGNFPSAIASGTYSVYGWRKLGGSPASTDTLIGTEIDATWDGSNLFEAGTGAGGGGGGTGSTDLTAGGLSANVASRVSYWGILDSVIAANPGPLTPMIAAAIDTPRASQVQRFFDGYASEVANYFGGRPVTPSEATAQFTAYANVFAAWHQAALEVLALANASSTLTTTVNAAGTQVETRRTFT